MPFSSLVPEVLQKIAILLIPREATKVFDDEFGDDRANIWEFDGRKFPVKDNLFTLRDVRSLSNTCRLARTALSRIIGARVRIVNDDLLDLDPTPMRHLHLIPTSYVLNTEGQIRLLSKIDPDQLISLSLSVFPDVLLDNLAGGFGSSDPYEKLLIGVARLHVPHVRIVSNVIGLVPSVMKLEDVSHFELDDQGFWDGGHSESYAPLASSQHRNLRDLIRKLPLKKLTYRRKVITHRPREYAFFDFANILRFARESLTGLHSLAIRQQNVSVDVLREIFESCENLQAFIYYPPTPHQLPKPPRGLRILRTNCSLPPEEDVMPPQLVELSVRRDGPLLPLPPDDYVPRMTPTLTVLHAHVAPGVSLESFSTLLRILVNLQDLEILALPLPWSDHCTCEPVSGNLAQTLDYKTAFQKHNAVDPSDLGWRYDITIPVLVKLLVPLPLDSLTINHDHYLATHPFPDIHHMGPTAAKDNAGVWWRENREYYAEQAGVLFGGLPILDLKWRVCSSRQRWRPDGGQTQIPETWLADAGEAWMIWERGQQGRLLVEM